MRVAWRGEFKLTLSVMRVLFSFVTREKATGHGRKMKALEVSAVANLQLGCLFFYLPLANLHLLPGRHRKPLLTRWCPQRLLGSHLVPLLDFQPFH